MVKYFRLISVIFMIISLSSLYAQSEPEGKSYWFYTTSNEMKDFQINGIENDQLVLNNGSWDVKVSLNEVEIILKPPSPSGRGQFLGRNLGTCGGMCVGFLAGVIVFPKSLGVREEGINGLRAFIIAGALGGSYYGRKMGANYLKGEPEILVDMTMWTLDEKKEYIQTNLLTRE